MELTSENCLFLDELDDDTFKDVIDAISTKTEEVINDKLVSQGLKPLDEEEIVEEPSPDIPLVSLVMDAPEEEAKNKLINSISQAMTEAIEKGKTFSLIDLMVLEIPDSTFSVSIEGDVAILNIDGFEFKLNSEFQLYE